MRALAITAKGRGARNTSSASRATPSKHRYALYCKQVNNLLTKESRHSQNILAKKCYRCRSTRPGHRDLFTKYCVWSVILRTGNNGSTRRAAHKQSGRTSYRSRRPRNEVPRSARPAPLALSPPARALSPQPGQSTMHSVPSKLLVVLTHQSRFHSSNLL